MLSGIFHSTQIAPNAIEGKGEVRDFIGDGTPILKVPGLLKLESVHVGRTHVPLERDYKFPLNSDAERKEKVRITLPHVVATDNEVGEKVLLRSKHSNDGIWQLNAKIFVGGEWESPASTDAGQSAPKTDSAPPIPEATNVRGVTTAEVKK